VRIERLDLTRFGGFTDRSLDLSAEGVHVIVGANEAGKTTAMAAIQQLLYGIPVQSVHDYLHSYQDMRIGARIRAGDGVCHEIVRLKRNANALRDPDDQPIEDAALAAWLYDVDKSLYESVFAISHHEIEEGGKALLDSDGDLGRAVFSTSRGTTDLNAVLRKLDERIEGLYKRAGQNPKLNAAIREYKVRLERASALSVNAREVTDLDAQLRGAQAAREDLARRRTTLLARREVLERIRAARPQLAERQERTASRDRLVAEGPLVEPPVDAELATARERRRAARERHAAATEAIARVDQQLAGHELDAELLAQRDVIARLQAATGAYRQNLDDLPRRRGALHDADVALAALRERLPSACPRGPSGDPALTADQHARITALAEEFPRRDEQVTQAADQVAQATLALEDLQAVRAARPLPREHRILEEALARIQAHGDLGGERAATAKDLADIDGRLAAAVARLGLAGGDPRLLDAIPVPSAETLREHREALEAAGHAVEHIREQIEVLSADREASVADLATLLRGAAPPSDAELANVRADRDSGWALLRAVWRDGADPDDAVAWARGRSLDEAYLESVRDADHIADRLRHEAGAVERRSSLEAQIATCERRLATEAARLEEATTLLAARQAAWAGLWRPAGVSPSGPAAMERWRDAFREAVDDASTARERLSVLAAIDAAIVDAQRELSALSSAHGAPAPDGASLAGLVAHVGRLMRDASDAHARDLELATATGDAEVHLRSCTLARTERTRGLETWREAWAGAVAVLGLQGSATPTEAQAVLRVIGEIGAQRRTRDDAIGRIGGIEQRNQDFVRGVDAIIAALPAHRDLAARPPEIAVAMLVDRREVAQRVATTHETLTHERERHVETLELAHGAMRNADGRIAELIARSGVDGEAGLDAAIARSRTHAEALERIAAIEQALRQAFGRTIDDLVAEVAAMGDEEIAPLVVELGAELEDVNARWETESTRVGELGNRRAQITASGDAAEALEQAQQTLAEVADAAEQYVQAVLARRLLEEEISAYRAAHQGPVMMRAHALFAPLTLGRYAGLDIDTGARGEPMLRARAASGHVIDVASLSTGTRDQLYLALRLAALEGLIARRGPLPLLLDDLFVHFDDARTDAGLRVLEQIAERTQVLLFTHHQRVAEQALGAISAGRAHLIELEPMIL
jgi:uncharacterized protein YhaN